MTPIERRTFWGCALGWALDGLDFTMYPLVIGAIMAMWQVSAGDAGLAVTATLLCSAMGGWLAGLLSDRIGRVRTLQLTILWFSAFSLICAFAQNFQQLMIARALLGFGFGGEWAAGAVLMGETIRAQYRGRAVGSVQSAWAVGWGAAVAAQALLFSMLPAEAAWRWMFALGALFLLALPFLDRSTMRGKKSLGWTVVFLALLGYAVLFQILAWISPGPEHPRQALAAKTLSLPRSLVSLGLVWAVIGFLVYYLRQLVKENTRVRRLYEEKPAEELQG